MGILDTIKTTNQKESLQEFEINLVINQILKPLKERERIILSKRYGLLGEQVQTLKAIGEEQDLTRERVRQIEKELLKNLKQTATQLDSFIKARDLLIETISEHGGIMSEKHLIDKLNIDSLAEKNAVRFILNLITEVELHEKDKHVRTSWSKLGFDKTFVHDFLNETIELFKDHKEPLTVEGFNQKFKSSKFFDQYKTELPQHVVTNFLHASKKIKQNPFDEYGLEHWNDIKPKDVGDKAYMVMKHHGKPEHYSTITELINKQGIDKRTAYKETVHNKLIKDKRFVLIGRGIYALSEWGYKPGVVSDIIKRVLEESEQPMDRDEIIDQVLKKRLVKRNTVLVGLSNRKLFKKTGKNQYTLA